MENMIVEKKLCFKCLKGAKMNHIRARSIATMGLTYYRLWRVIIKKKQKSREQGMQMSCYYPT